MKYVLWSIEIKKRNLYTFPGHDSKKNYEKQL